MCPPDPVLPNPVYRTTRQWEGGLLLPHQPVRMSRGSVQHCRSTHTVTVFSTVWCVSKDLALFFLRHAAKEWGKGGTDGRVAGVRGEERRYLIILHLPSRRVGLVRPGQHAQNGRLTSAIMFKLSNFQEKKKLRCLTENNNIQ